jgi:hypothetical protein
MLHGLVRIMCSTSQSQILDARLATDGIRDDMVELEESGLAASAVGADERALAAITLPYDAADVRRHSARVGDGADGGPRRAGLRQPPALEQFDEHCQGSFDNGRRITGRQSIPQQVLSPAELFVRLSTDRDSDQVSFRRERRDCSVRTPSRNLWSTTVI